MFLYSTSASTSSDPATVYPLSFTPSNWFCKDLYGMKVAPHHLATLLILSRVRVLIDLLVLSIKSIWTFRDTCRKPRNENIVFYSCKSKFVTCNIMFIPYNKMVGKFKFSEFYFYYVVLIDIGSKFYQRF